MRNHEEFQRIAEIYTNLKDDQALKIKWGYGNFEPYEKIIYPGDYICMDINKYNNRAEIHFYHEEEVAYVSYWKVAMDSIKNIEIISIKGDIMTENIHKDCENYNESKDMCLKWFEENVSEKYKVCKEYSEFNDKELQRKWSN